MNKEMFGSVDRAKRAKLLRICCGAALLLGSGFVLGLQAYPHWWPFSIETDSSAPWNRKPGAKTILSFKARHFDAFRPGSGDPVVATSSEVRDVLRDKKLYELPLSDTKGGWLYAAFSPDGKLLATAASLEGNTFSDPRFKLRLHDAETGNELGLLHCGPKDSWGGITFSPDGQFLAETCGEKIHIWSVRTYKEVHCLQHEGFVQRMVYHPDGKLLVSEEQGSLYFWDVEKGQLLNKMSGENDHSFQGLAISPNGQFLATAQARTAVEKGVYGWKIYSSICLVDLASRNVVAEFPEQHGPILHITFRHNGRWLASTCGDPSVNIWDIPNKKLLYTLPHDHSGTAVSFSPDDRWLATADGQHVKLWDLVPDTQ